MTDQGVAAPSARGKCAGTPARRAHRRGVPVGGRGMAIVAALTTAMLLLVPGPWPVQAAAGNILLLIADDFGVDLAGFYAVPGRVETTPPPPPTPNLTALARQGVLFPRAWASPTCSPTRAGILTGRYGFRTGVGDAKRRDMPQLPPDEITLPEVFRAAATRYRLAHVGKWHLSNGIDDPNRQGWTHYLGPEPRLGGLDYYDWTKVVDGVATRCRTYATTDQVNDAVGVIAAARAQDRPYFAWVAFNAPHRPYHKPPNGLHSLDGLPDRGGPDRSYLEAMVEALDTEIGRLLREVDLATTTVIFLGDNGTQDSSIAPPYSPPKAKGTVYDAGVRVPLVVAGEAVRGPGRTVAALVNAVDLFPTILELAGIETGAGPPAGIGTDGISLMPYLRNRSHPSPRAWAFAERFSYRFDGDWQRAIRDRRYTLLERHDGTREFYNLALDPLQGDDLLRRPLTVDERRALDSLDLALDALMASR